jgi:serine/threonine protein kinase
MNITPSQLVEVDRTLYRQGFTRGEEIGGGGCAVVYEIRSHKYRENSSFALKLVNRTLEDEDIIESFTAEANALSRIAHPNVIQFFSFFKSPSFLYLVLEFCPGGSMQTVIERYGAVPTAQLARYGGEVVSALRYCHGMQIAHRDIKPSNILIDKYNRAKLADFGLAMLTVHKELVEKYCGSLSYVAPEIIQKHPFDALAADIWSLGVTLFEMTTGKLPWESLDIENLKDEIIKGSFQIPAGMPVDFAAAIQRMIVIDPSERATADELAALPVFQGHTKELAGLRATKVLSFGCIPRGRMAMKPGSRSRSDGVMTFTGSLCTFPFVGTDPFESPES